MGDSHTQCVSSGAQACDRACYSALHTQQRPDRLYNTPPVHFTPSSAAVPSSTNKRPRHTLPKQPFPQRCVFFFQLSTPSNTFPLAVNMTHIKYCDHEQLCGLRHILDAVVDDACGHNIDGGTRRVRFLVACSRVEDLLGMQSTSLPSDCTVQAAMPMSPATPDISTESDGSEGDESSAPSACSVSQKEPARATRWARVRAFTALARKLLCVPR